MPKDKYSRSDRNAARTAMPFSKKQTPATTTTITSPATGKVLGRATMNYGGVAGGNPTRDAGELRKRAKGYDLEGARASAQAAQTRAAAVERSDRMNKEAMRDMKSQARERSAAAIRAKRPK